MSRRCATPTSSLYRMSEARTQIAVRLTPEGLAAIEKRATADARTRSDTIRLMLAYAERHMPKGWVP